MSKPPPTTKGRKPRREWCRGTNRCAPVGSVGLGYRADCVVCGKRVFVTVRGLFMRHYPLSKDSQP